MCGIAGIFEYGGGAARVDRLEIERVRERMACRGPDGARTWVDATERVALAHRRLAIIDLSDRAAQPMSTADGLLTVTFNGEIYNYKDLRRSLVAQGRSLRTDSDTEILLHLYDMHGEGMLPLLRGMFAFVIWDARRSTLFAARDPFGIKPLYVADDGTSLRLASEVKALLAGGKIKTDADPAGRVGFYLWGHVPEPFTMYKAIRALPAGSCLSANEHGVVVKRYCRIADFLSEEQQESAPNGAEDLNAALVDSVRHHLVADVDVGVFLSAGLDSTAIAALAAGLGGQVRTVTLGFEEYRGTERDETILATKFASAIGADHRTVWINKTDFVSELGRITDRMDQPSIDGVNSYFVAKAASDTGLKVALSGLGGDELFGGYPSFAEIPKLVSAVSRLPLAQRFGKGMRQFLAPLIPPATSPKYAGVLEYGHSVASAYLLRRSLFMPWELPKVLDQDLVDEGLERLCTLERLQATASGVSEARFKISALEAEWYMRNQLLRDTDWASMSHSLEVRVPLVDPELWRAVASLGRGGSVPTKSAMAWASGARLSQEVVARPKTGFTTPTRDWLAEELGNRYAGRGLRGWAQYIDEVAA
jgi:asparagine synthase (glutamine-hydrolysing)